MPTSLIESERAEWGAVDSPLLFRAEVAGEVAEALDIDGADLLNEHAS